MSLIIIIIIIIINVTWKSSDLVQVHDSLKLWTTSQSLSPNASNCDEEIEVFYPVVVSSLACLKDISDVSVPGKQSKSSNHTIWIRPDSEIQDPVVPYAITTYLQRWNSKCLSSCACEV